MDEQKKMERKVWQKPTIIQSLSEEELKKELGLRDLQVFGGHQQTFNQRGGIESEEFFA